MKKGKMKKSIKLLILTNLIFSTLAVAKTPTCKERVTMQFGNYIAKCVEFFRDNECIESDIEVLVNKETNQSIKLDGFITGIESFGNILKVKYHAGVHTNVVDFYRVSENGDLKLIEGGSIASDVGDPAIYLDSLNDKIIVMSRYTRDIKSCRYLYEDAFEYEKGKFKKISESTLLADGEGCPQKTPLKFPWLKGLWRGELSLHGMLKKMEATFEYGEEIAVSFPNNYEGEVNMVEDKEKTTLHFKAGDDFFSVTPLRGDTHLNPYDKLSNIKVIYVQYSHNEIRYAGWLERVDGR